MTTQTHFTVEQASRWLTCPQPVALPLLQRLGKDCSMVCRIRGATFVDVPVQGKNWPTERGYPAAIIQEVFLANPDTRAFVPKPVAAPASRGHRLTPVPKMEGLSQCTVCGGSEGTLPTDCPGEQIAFEALERIHHGEIDFVGGMWRHKAPTA